MWQTQALRAFWLDRKKYNAPLNELPKVGKSYRVCVHHHDTLQAGELIDVQYSSSSVNYYGFENAEDLQRLRFVSGEILEVFELVEQDAFSRRTMTEVRLKVLNATSLKDFRTIPLSSEDSADIWHPFLSNGTFKNLRSIGDYFHLHWALDSHAGGELIMRRPGEAFEALYWHGWQTGTHDQVCVGRVKPPERLSVQVGERLQKMNDNAHWYGRAL